MRRKRKILFLNWLLLSWEARLLIAMNTFEFSGVWVAVLLAIGHADRLPNVF